MAVALAVVASVADLQHLLAAHDGPRVFAVSAVPVPEAPQFLQLVRDLQHAGWPCRNPDEVRLVATFAATLERLAVEVFPVLHHHPHNLAALRAMRSCGHAALEVRQSTAAGGADYLYSAAGRFSNCLERKARRAIQDPHHYTVPEGWIVRKADEVHMMRADRIYLDFDAPVLPPVLPQYLVTSIDDVRALAYAGPVPRQDIYLLAVEVLREAPVYRDAVAHKLAQGWICPSFDLLDRAARFAAHLEDLINNVVGPLMFNPENPAALRRLRAIGQAITKIRRGAHAHGPLVDIMAKYANNMRRYARNALNPHIDFELTHEWVYDLAWDLYEDLESMIQF